MKGWLNCIWVKFGIAFLLVFIVGPAVARVTGFSDMTNVILWLTGAVILFYTVETQGLRLEMVRQNEMAIQPLIIASVEPRTIQGIAPTSIEAISFRNIGRGPALFVEVKDVDYGEEGGQRLVGRFEKIDCIESGRSADIAEVELVWQSTGQPYKQWLDFTAHLHPRYANRSYDVTFTYEDINGQKRESVVRMGKGGIRLLKHGKV